MKKILVFTVLLLLAGVAIGPFLQNAKANPDITFPSVLNRTAAINAATTSHSVSIPGPLGNIGNLLIIAISTDGTSASLVVPSGWGEIFNTTNTDRTTVYVRISDGTEISPITIISTLSVASAYHAWRITDANGNVFTVPAAIGSSTAPDPPVNNIGGPALAYLWFAVATTNGASCNANPSDYTNGAAVVGSGVVECRAERKLETSSENPSPFGLTGSSGWLALTLAIEPEQTTEDMTPIILIMLLFAAFVILLIFGLIERFAMVGAAIVAFFIAIESWVITTNVVLPAMFVFIGVVCIGVSITRRV
jgi:hypothetical protein